MATAVAHGAVHPRGGGREVLPLKTLQRNWRKVVQDGECIEADLRQWCPGLYVRDLQDFLAGSVVGPRTHLILDFAWKAWIAGRLTKRKVYGVFPKEMGAEAIRRFIGENESIFATKGEDLRKAWVNLEMGLREMMARQALWKKVGIDLPERPNGKQLETLGFQVDYIARSALAWEEESNAHAHRRRERFMSDALRIDKWQIIVARLQQRDRETRGKPTSKSEEAKPLSKSGT